MCPTPNPWTQFAPVPIPLSGAMEWNIFLSYRSVNRRWVINLYDVLKAHGHKVFLNQCTITAGDQLVRVLENGLSKSQAGVLVWSAAGEDSEWVRREYEVMERKSLKGGFHFVPTRLDGTPLPEFAENRVFLDFSQYPDGPNGGELLRLLHAVVGRPLSPEAASFALEQDETARLAAAQIRAAVKNGQVADLVSMFEAGGPVWESSSALGCAVAEGLTKLKQDDAALTSLATLEQRFPRAIRPKQLRALALARRALDGDLSKAQAILGTLYELGERDPETLGIYGRTWMDVHEKSKDPLHLRQSRDLYAEAFAAAQDDYYTGINAAAKSILLATAADVARGREIAERVLRIVGTSTVPRDYWKTATVGECQLLLGKYAEAGARYADAVAMAPNERGSHESTWKQACRLMRALGLDGESRAPIRQAFVHLPECP